jgi:hypothetical protein
METLNVRADYHVSFGLNQNEQPEKIITPIPSSKVSLIVHGITITSHYATHLRKAATRPALLKRCCTHYQWKEETFNSVDWQAHHGALQKLRFTDKKFTTKYIHQLLPMGKTFQKIDPTHPLTCSSCLQHDKSEEHLLQCPQRRDAMEYFLNVTLTHFFDKTHICPELCWCLASILSSQIRGTEPKFGTKHGRSNPDFHDLMVAQHAIGWKQLFQGRFDKRWSRLQADYLDRHGQLKLDRK